MHNGQFSLLLADSLSRIGVLYASPRWTLFTVGCLLFPVPRPLSTSHVLAFVDGFIHGIEIGAGAGIDEVGTGSLAAEALAIEIRMDKHLADGIFAPAHCMNRIVDQLARNSGDFIDRPICGFDGPVAHCRIDEKLARSLLNLTVAVAIA